MRVFVAVPVPDDVKAAVAEAGRELAGDGISLVRPGNMHLTLRFIGEAQPHAVESMRERLREVGFARFGCRVKGVGVFPSQEYVRVVWAGCESGGALEALAGKVGTSLHGFGGDERFTAHLTIARLKRRIDVRPFLSRHAEEEFGSFEVERFGLIESVLGGPGGPKYRTVEEFAARG